MPDYVYRRRKQPVRIRLDGIATRPPGQDWTVQSGPWYASGPTKQAAAAELADGIREFITNYRPPMVLMFRGYTAIVELNIGGDDGLLKWVQRTIGPDGPDYPTVDHFEAPNAAEAEAHARNSLAFRTTDWHDDTSVHQAAVYLEYGPRCAATHRGLDELYRHAAWERAVTAASNAGSEDWQAWAEQHQEEFAIRRPTAEEVRAALHAMRP